ncbi:leucyl/phenylalanyl-tRNA--protein transferase [uncultured Azonexus sp.]|uniref:leucyl/phenylalanyl-tRNA--protein transferase n=1 Tax=uncultured Azonexus sp. TaxID=520307 RepID=UPI0026304D64|nr:leucyl/phenylalanyl-tRNA--protein transferase [uncultured Azonexus sp.]
MIPFLGPLDPFPPVTEARQDMNGLLAVGGLLLPDRLLDAYRRGIFPWGTIEGQALWYSPDPRMVMFPENFRLSRSLRRLLRSDTLTISADRDFPAVIAACAATRRRGQDGTWISDEMMEAYTRLHELGWAHSVEVWEEGELVGGLYGLAIGRMFYGESMFSRRDNASKFAFAYLIRLLRERGFGMIDCQMHTDHLASLGAAEIPRSEFLQRMQTLIGQGERSVWQLAVSTDW